MSQVYFCLKTEIKTLRFENKTKTLIFISSYQEWLAHSKNELIQWRGVCRLSVCLSVCPSVNFCANRFFSQTKWPDRHQTFTRWTPGQHASRVCSRSRSRSKVTWYAHFLGFLEWATPSLTVWFVLEAPRRRTIGTNQESATQPSAVGCGHDDITPLSAQFNRFFESVLLWVYVLLCYV